ncbi:hypothetical protein EUGRSUZ_H03099 [Eucalyptus grandis]|uniref:Uncharacterized protein n=2 Tax=Eucalyptus grandis TaxID=71139 RepID=A0ACC3JTV0_EUCGR|nr:hypothetical protein EUGRSUZ_H03099 [Eucalyptus grandis]
MLIKSSNNLKDLMTAMSPSKRHCTGLLFYLTLKWLHNFKAISYSPIMLPNSSIAFYVTATQWWLQKQSLRKEWRIHIVFVGLCEPGLGQGPIGFICKNQVGQAAWVDSQAFDCQNFGHGAPGLETTTSPV